MPIKKENKIEKEYKGQFPSKNCECHIQKPYGFIPEADCPEHDTKQFSDFLKAQKTQTLQALKEEIEIMMNEIATGKKLLKSAKLSNWKEDDACIKGQLQALTAVIKLIEKYEK